MSWFSDALDGISNFFGGGRKDEDEERRRRQQQSQSRPTTPSRSSAPTVREPQAFGGNMDMFEAPEALAPKKSHQIGSLDASVRHAAKSLQDGGAGAPFAPEIIKKAREANKPTVKPIGGFDLPGQVQEQNERQESIRKANAKRAEQIAANPSAKEYNSLDARNQRFYANAIEDKRKTISPTDDDGLTELARLATAQQSIQEDGKGKLGGPAEWFGDLVRGTSDYVGESGLKSIGNSYDLAKRQVGGATTGMIQTPDQLEVANQAYAAGKLPYDDLLHAFRQSPELYNANNKYAISKDGGIQDISDDAGKQLANFGRDFTSAGATTAQFAPIGFASNAATAGARFASRFGQGALFNSGSVLGEALANPAANKTAGEIATDTAVSGLLGGVMEGVIGAKGKTPTPPLVPKNAAGGVIEKVMARNGISRGEAIDLINEVGGQPKIPTETPGSPVTRPEATTTNKPSAITSANRQGTPASNQMAPKPTPEQPTTTLPQQPEPQPLTQAAQPQEPVQALAPEQPVGPSPVELEQLRMQQAIEQQALQPAPDPLQTEIAPPVNPRQVEAAQQRAPIDIEAVAQAEAAALRQSAPTEAAAQGPGARGVAEGSDTYDQKIQRLDDDFEAGRITNEQHAQAEEALFREANGNGEVIAALDASPSYKSPHGKNGQAGVPGNSKVKYSAGTQEKAAPKSDKPYTELEGETAQARSEWQKLVDHFDGDREAAGRMTEKMYNSSNDGDTGGARGELTPLEKKAYDEILQPLTTDSARRIDKNYGTETSVLRRDNYSPTGKAGTVEVPVTRSQLNTENLGEGGFGFNAKRKGGLKSEDFTGANAEDAFVRQRVVALGSDKFTPEDRIAFRKQQIEGQKSKWYDDEPNADGTPSENQTLKQTDAEKAKMADEAENIARREVEHSTKLDKLEEDLKTGKLSKKEKSARTKEVVDSANAVSEANRTSHAQTLVDFDIKAEARYKEISAERKKLGTSRNAADLKKGAELKVEKKALQKRHKAVHADTHYMQATTATNVLFQPRGRIADTVQNVSEMTAGKLTNAGSIKGANKSYAKHSGGEKLFGNAKESSRIQKQLEKEELLKTDVRKNTEFNAEYSKLRGGSVGRKAANRVNTAGTLATELPSRGKAATRDTVRVFVAEGERAGLKGDALTDYVRGQVGGPDWTSTNKMLWEYHNAHTGVASMGRTSSDPIETTLGKTGNLTDAMARQIPGLSLAQTASVSKGMDIFLTSFTRAAYRITKQSVKRSMLGGISFVKAGQIKGTTKLDNWNRAMLVRQGISDAAVGTTLGVAGVTAGIALASDDRISGGYPTGGSSEAKAERARWQREGITEYSIKLGDGDDAKWLNFSRYIPSLYVPMMIGGLVAKGDGAQAPMAFVEAAKGAYANTGIEGFIGLGGDLFDVARGKRGWADTVGRFGASGVTIATPLSGIWSTLARAFDDSDRDTEGDNPFDSFRKSVQKKFPGLRNQLDEKTDAFGETIKNDRVSSLFYVDSGAAGTAVTEELNRLSAGGVEAFPKSTAGTGKHQKLKTEDDAEIKLSSKQQLDLDNTVKKEKTNQANLVMGTDAYKDATDTEKGAMLHEVYNLDSTATAATWAKNNGIEGVKSTGANINNNLDGTLQTAIMEHKLQGDKKDAWLDSTKNSRNYHEAMYKNKDANGELSAKDNDTEKMTSLKYKMVAAKVNDDFGTTPELLQLYENTNKTEFKNMPEGPEKDKLRALDEARAEAGVSRNSSDKKSPKYSSKGKGGKGRGRGGKKGGGSFGFAQLPASLTTGKPGGKYASDVSLFKGVDLLKSNKGTVQGIGKKNISVKKGVHL